MRQEMRGFEDGQFNAAPVRRRPRRLSQLFAQLARDAGEAARSADVGAEGVDPTVELAQQLAAKLTVPLDHIGVSKLVRGEAADLVDDLRSALDHARNELRRDPLRARQHLELGAEGPHRRKLLFGVRI